jgi:hypothetical protein
MPAIRSFHWQSSSICLLPEPATARRPFPRPCTKFATQPLHGYLCGLTVGAIQICLIRFAQSDFRNSAARLSLGKPESAQCIRVVAAYDAIAVNTCTACCGYLTEIPWVEYNHGNGFPKDFFRNHNAEGEDIVLTLGHYGCGSLSREKKLQDNPAARAGATSTRNDENLICQDLATQGMMPVDDFTAEWIDAAPEAQLHIAGDDFTQNLAMNEGGAGEDNFAHDSSSYRCGRRACRSS